MLGRREFGLMGLSAAGLAALDATLLARSAHAADDPHHGEHREHFEACAKACSDCQRECDSCARHCVGLVAEGHKDHLETAGTCIDCAEFCAAAARITSRGGPFADLICTSCAEACARCAKACEKFPQDEHMKKCAEECRKCEKACREMLTHMSHKA